MENSVTLTLARYHDLIDIERDFDKKVESRLSKEKTEWVKQENSIARKFESQWRDSNKRIEFLEKQLAQAKGIIFYMGGAFFICIVALILSRILQ